MAAIGLPGPGLGVVDEVCQAHLMNAILLTWNPTKWDDWDYDALTREVEEQGSMVTDWSISRHRHGIEIGTEVWFFKQGGKDPELRGILGHGTVLNLLLDREARVDPTKEANFVSVRFDLLLPETDVLSVPTLEAEVPGFGWRSIRSSGAPIQEEHLPSVRKVWAQHTAELGRSSNDRPTGEGFEIPGTYPEGAVRTVLVNRYERDPKARQECTEHHGLTCKVCGFDFQERYGKIGADYIQVHHVVPISQIGAGYMVDPIADLVPLCANCHAMAHRRSPDPFTVDELKERLT